MARARKPANWPPTKDPLQPNGRPVCSEPECSWPAVSVGRVIDQSGADARSSTERYEYKNYGHWKTVWACGGHAVWLAFEVLAHDITLIHQPKAPKPAPDPNVEQLKGPWVTDQETK